ncbi:hypothetical protein KBC75_04830 [Candidatus Shapirobacteria bacterium]|nr:hypothetical protein [Candidatus Shapirobacteria bacterium]
MINQNIIKLILVISLVSGFFYTSAKLLSLRTQQLKNEAVNGCMVASGIYEYTDVTKGIKTTAPQKETYKICLIDKGYSSIWE